tara:strand:- start:1153 stop:2304 length:1152 start_codon:yes stop_codon:yes gene_type:complete
MKIVTFASKTLGDTIMATPLYRALRSMYPNEQIDLITEIENHPVLKGVNLFDKEILFKENIDFTDYDLAVMPVYCCQRIVPKLAQAAKRYVDFRHFYPKKPKSIWKRLSSAYAHMLFEKHQVELNIELLQSLGYQGKIPDMYCPLPDREIYSQYKGKVGLCIYTPKNEFQKGNNRFWPLENWNKLGTFLGGENLIILGSDFDKPNMEKLASLGNLPFQITKNIGDFIGLCQQLKLLITTDHGAMHMAAVSGVPIISLHGASSPVLLHPWVQGGGKSISVISPKFCSPCQRSYRVGLCEREITKMKCMSRITPELIVKAVKVIESMREGESKILFSRKLLSPQEFKNNWKVKFRNLLNIIVSREIIRVIKLFTNRASALSKGKM